MPKLRMISVELPSKAGSSYQITVGSGILNTMVHELGAFVGTRRAMVLTDDRVEGLWATTILDKLRASGINVGFSCVPEGELSKSWESAQSVLGQMMDFSLNRDSSLILVGGGVVGDLGGFVASVYMRGISFIQVPTTLLAQVDSCVGGKTAVDLPQAKNAVGTFHQPAAVFVDTDFLSTLPVSALANGMAEVIKYGLIRDTSILDLLEGAGFNGLRDLTGLWPEIVTKCLTVKSEVVSRDEHDRGERMILNFGHTVGHALEVITRFQMPHGIAISYGMSAACRISENMGLIDSSVSERVDALLHRFDLPTVLPEDISPEDILECLPRDKKVSDGKIRWVLLEGPGRAFVTDKVSPERVINALKGQGK